MSPLHLQRVFTLLKGTSVEPRLIRPTKGLQNEVGTLAKETLDLEPDLFSCLSLTIFSGRSLLSAQIIFDLYLELLAIRLSCIT